MMTITHPAGHGDLEIRSLQPWPSRVLLRHADAGVRAEASQPDAWRALTPLGWVQANGVVGRLRHVTIVRLFTSPALRCRQTVVPLARSLSADIEPRAELAIDADPHRLLDFLRDPETEQAVLCTHRETLDRLFTLVSVTGGGGQAVDGVAPMAKAAIWTIRPRTDSGQPVIRYLSPGTPQS
jgi:phosphohistidine phosphatase SixA